MEDQTNTNRQQSVNHNKSEEARRKTEAKCLKDLRLLFPDELEKVTNAELLNFVLKHLETNQALYNKNLNNNNQKLDGDDSLISDREFKIILQEVFQGFDFELALQTHKPLYVSTMVSNVLGYTQDEFMQIENLQFLHPDDVQTFLNCSKNLSSTRRTSKRKSDSKNDQKFDYCICRLRKKPQIQGRDDYISMKIMYCLKYNTTNDLVTTLYAYATYFDDGIFNNDEGDVITFNTRHNQTGIIEIVDIGIKKLLGYDPKELIGHTIGSMCDGGQEAKFKAAFDQLLKNTNETCVFEMEFRLSNNVNTIKFTTKLSCFVNPSNQELEFIDAEHTIQNNNQLVIQEASADDWFNTTHFDNGFVPVLDNKYEINVEISNQPDENTDQYQELFV